MVTNQEITRIKRMSFRELRDELGNCDNNPVKERIIRSLMKEKYIHYLKKKKELQQREQLRRKQKYQKLKNLMAKKYDTKYRKFYEGSKEGSIESILDDIDFEDNKERKVNWSNEFSRDFWEFENSNFKTNIRDEDINPFPNHGHLNELEDDDRLYDTKFRDELNKDYMNNNLLDRMNSEIDIRKGKVANKKDFIPPFANKGSGQFAPFHKQKNIPQSDFSNKRIMREASN